MPFHRRILLVLSACCPFHWESQAINLTFLIEAILAKRSVRLTAPAKVFPVPMIRREPIPSASPCTGSSASSTSRETPD